MIIEKIRKVTTRINEVLDIVNYYADQYKPLINTLEDYYNKVVREDQLREQIFLLKVKKYTFKNFHCCFNHIYM